MEDYEARVNITWAGSNGDLAEPVNAGLPDEQILDIVTEAVRSGTVGGIEADTSVSFEGFVVDRFPATDVRPYQLISIRPKTPFGG